MKILHLSTIDDGFIVEDCEWQTAVALMEDGGDMFAAIVDNQRRTSHIVKIINRNSAFLFNSFNMERIEDDEQWNAYSKFLYDNGLGVIIDGLRLKESGTIKQH